MRCVYEEDLNKIISIGNYDERKMQGYIPETQVVWVKFLMLCWASFLERLRTIAIILVVF